MDQPLWNSRPSKPLWSAKDDELRARRNELMQASKSVWEFVEVNNTSIILKSVTDPEVRWQALNVKILRVKMGQAMVKLGLTELSQFVGLWVVREYRYAAMPITHYTIKQPNALL